MRRALAFVGLVLLSAFLFDNYQPPEVAASNFFGTYAGSIVLFGVSLEHEFAGLGLIIGVIALIMLRLRLEHLPKDFDVLGVSRGAAIASVAGSLLMISDVQGLDVLSLGAVVSILIGLIYAGLLHAAFPKTWGDR